MKLKEDESHITKNWGGAMLVKIVILLWQNWSHITKFRISQMGNGGDVDENCHFIKRKWVAHYQKLRGRCWWKSSFYWGKISRTLPNFEYQKHWIRQKFNSLKNTQQNIRDWRIKYFIYQISLQWLTQNAFYYCKTAIFIHFHQDRPPSPFLLRSIPYWNMDQWWIFK